MIKSNTPPDSIARRYIAAFVRVFVLAAFLVTAFQSSALAADWRAATVHNRTGQTITAVYIQAAPSDNWGENYISSAMPAGYNFSIQYITGCKYDFKYILDDGRDVTSLGVYIDGASNIYFNQNPDGSFSLSWD